MAERFCRFSLDLIRSWASLNCLPTLDFESEKLEALRNVHNPGLLPVERHTELFEYLFCSGQDVLGLSSRPTGHTPNARPSRELISMSPHLLIKGSQQDVAQHRRNDTPLRGSLWRFKLPALVFVACLERLLNELQRSAVGDLLSNQSQEFVVIDRP